MGLKGSGVDSVKASKEAEEMKKGQEVILIGFHPERGGVELIAWTIKAAAGAGDVVIVLIVCDPSSTLLTGGVRSDEEQEYGVEKCVAESKRSGIRAQLQQLRQLSKQKQIQMDIKFEGGHHPEEVLVEQAKALNASTLVIGTSDRFVSWRKRMKSNYCIRNAPARCSVITVKSGKLVHLKKNRMDVPSDSSSSSAEAIQVSVQKQDSEDNLQEQALTLSNVIKDNFNVIGKECQKDSDPTDETPEGAFVKQETREDQPFEDVPMPSPSSPDVVEIFFDMNDDDDDEEEDKEVGGQGHKIFSEQAKESLTRGLVEEEQGEDHHQTHGDSETCLSTSPNVLQVYFDANEEGEEEDEDDEGGNCKTWCEQTETGRSSPRGVLERSVAACLDSDSSSSPTSNSNDSFSGTGKAIITSPSDSHWENEKGHGRKSSQWRNFLRMWKQGSMRRLSTFPPRSGFRLPRHRSSSGDFHSRTDSFSQSKDNQSFCDQILTLEKHLTDITSKPSWKCFSLEELECATNNFSPDNIIGRGGYAEVFKGYLSDGQIVAVKRLNRGNTEEQKVGDFLSELGIIVHINHPNAACLIGFGIEGGLHIVLKFSPHGSLASMLHGPNPQHLNWDIRYRVAVGTAKGLLYLHEGCQRRIIHRDIKASNVLLTEDFEPQISDFGLAKWLPKQWTHITVTPIVGTFGYLAPEYFMHGVVDEKTDVFAFGVLLLELITGRRPIDSSQKNLVMWAKPLIDSGNFQELVDPSLGDSYDNHQLNDMVMTASLCIQQSALLRPCMAHVLKLLTGEGDNLENTDCGRTPISETLFLMGGSDTEDYTSTRYLSDLNRHREIALGQ
ncbi:hypothetical protein SUGI_0260020 [Cryptomeria japonica]|uniref:receptor-like cytosolic serine/threonine-protein kinase RBK2 n=1 Tax=Cryptomeria japonica TaxID=3369 RepID=UPI002408BAEA|nr:receptor-like cytosolic serine/threonine-protein kinase RBK2 [Cryptomeria japonica]GLJ15784.1 hypothetical protein SUGI_0260020 [Cryptomeria japonica]